MGHTLGVAQVREETPLRRRYYRMLIRKYRVSIAGSFITIKAQSAVTPFAAFILKITWSKMYQLAYHQDN